MTFLAPYYLWGMAGMMVPLAIHLWSRHNRNLVHIGSIRYLENAPPSHTMSLHLTEKWLLLLRMLLIALLSIILAGPMWEHENSRPARLILLEPELEGIQEIKDLIDTSDASVRYLRPGFPTLATGYTDTIPFSYWGLIADAGKLGADSITVFASSRMSFYRGKRPAVNEHVRWITMDVLEDDTASRTLLSYGGGSGTAHEVKYTYEDGVMRVAKNEGSLSLTPDTIRVEIVYGSGKGQEATLMEAAFATVGAYYDLPVVITKDTVRRESGAGWLVWLKSKNELHEQRENVIRSIPREPGPLLMPGKSEGSYYLNGSLTVDRVYNEQFLTSLAYLLDPYRMRDHADVLHADDLRTISFGTSPKVVLESSKEPDRQHASAPFWWVFFVLLLMERILSTRKK